MVSVYLRSLDEFLFALLLFLLWALLLLLLLLPPPPLPEDEELLVRVLQCCRASLATSEMNFWAATEIKRTILGSEDSNPAVFR